MMQLSFCDFMYHTGLTPDNPRAIPEYEIMHKIALMLPASTSPSVLRRLWRDAFRDADPVERRRTYRIRKGAFNPSQVHYNPTSEGVKGL